MDSAHSRKQADERYKSLSIDSNTKYIRENIQVIGSNTGNQKKNVRLCSEGNDATCTGWGGDLRVRPMRMQ